MRIVLTDPAHLTPEAVEQFRALPATVHDGGVPTSEEVVVDRLAGAVIAVTSYVKIGKGVLDAIGPQLRHLILPASGYQGVDRVYARERGVDVINTPTHNAPAVAEHAVGLMFAGARHIVAANEDLRDGNWRGGRPEFHGFELGGKSLTVVGAGNIGRHVGNIATGIGMETNFVRSCNTAREVDQRLADADVVCLTLPYSETTHHFIDERRLRLMKPGSLLVNVSRGAIVDQGALLGALKSGEIGGAALDVFEGEPVVGAADKTLSPEIRELCALPNVVATPHMGWNTKEAAIRQGQELMANVRACLAGSPINVVNPIPRLVA